jgi:hypothetical protein
MTLISKTELKQLADTRQGWCVSIYMPTHPAGPEMRQDPIRLKNLLEQAEERLVATGVRGPEARSLLEPANHLLGNRLFWRYQSTGLAVFLDQDGLHHYRLPLSFEDLVVVGHRFHLKPLLPLLSGDGRFFVLALSQNEIRLLQATRYSVAQVQLRHVPESLAEALRWDDPESQLQWHTGTGTESDGRAAIFHGHGVGNLPEHKKQILRYFQKIDAGLAEILADERAPLVLAGVEFLLPIYRQASSYQHLVPESITGNPEELSAQELQQRGWRIVEPLFERSLEDAEDRFRRLAGGDATATGLSEVVPAAFRSRLDTLFVALDTQRWGTYRPGDDDGVTVHQDYQPGDQDLLDVAAVQCFLHGGTVYAVDADEVPSGQEVAAICRF